MADSADEGSGTFVGKPEESARKVPRIAKSKYDRTMRHPRIQPIISSADAVRLQRTENREQEFMTVLF